MFARALSTSAVHYARNSIKKYPVTLSLLYPSWARPALHEFSSAKEITDFLAPKQFLYDPATGHSIRPNQVEKIDPSIVYEVAGSGLPYREKGLTREQVWDTVFERKSALALKESLEKDGSKVIALPRLVVDEEGKAVGEWEAIYELSDGCVVFLESKYRMSKTHIDDQLNRVSRCLITMGKETCDSRLYLAAYYWPNDACISYARNKGYGIIRPNGSDLTVGFKAEVLKPKKTLAC